MTSAESPAPRPNDALLSILADAYRPCPNFGICREAVWNPERVMLLAAISVQRDSSDRSK